eukprot:780246_1
MKKKRKLLTAAYRKPSITNGRQGPLNTSKFPMTGATANVNHFQLGTLIRARRNGDPRLHSTSKIECAARQARYIVTCQEIPGNNRTDTNPEINAEIASR